MPTYAYNLYLKFSRQCTVEKNSFLIENVHTNNEETNKYKQAIQRQVICSALPAHQAMPQASVVCHHS
jgi:hypothetical protein